MPQRRGTVTDQLMNVIQVIQLGRKTGLLTVERGEGIKREEGSIVFAHGQITEAYVSQLSGQRAVSWLSSWGRCRFTFVPADEATHAPLEFPSLKKGTGAIEKPASLKKGTGAIEKPASLPSTPATAPLNETYEAQKNEQHTNPYLRSYTVPSTPAWGNGPLEQVSPATGPLPIPEEAGNAFCPRRIRQDDEALRLLDHFKLSRTHRHLFLLIDGHRTTYELARLMGRRNQGEIQKLLYDLERIGVIQQ